MKITCPHCETTYELPSGISDTNDISTKKMRCSTCKGVFSAIEHLHQGADNTPPTGSNTDSDITTEPPISITDKPNEILKNTGTAIDKPTIEPLIKNKPNVPDEPPPERKPKSHFKHQFIGLAIAAVGIAFGIILMALVLGDEPEGLADTIGDFSIGQTESRELKSIDGRPIIVVNGRITNNADTARFNVMLEGTLLDENGNQLFKTTGPCGWFPKNKKIRKTPKGYLHKLFLRKMYPYNCVLKKNADKKFKLAFDNIPKDFEKKYKVSVRPLSASLKRIKRQLPKTGK